MLCQISLIQQRLTTKSFFDNYSIVSLEFLLLKYTINYGRFSVIFEVYIKREIPTKLAMKHYVFIDIFLYSDEIILS